MGNSFELWSPECITVGFIAKRCGVSNTTVLRWIESGLLPAFRLPAGHYRIETEDFAEFLRKHSIPVHHRLSKNKDAGEMGNKAKNAGKESEDNDVR